MVWQKPILCNRYSEEFIRQRSAFNLLCYSKTVGGERDEGRVGDATQSTADTGKNSLFCLSVDLFKAAAATKEKDGAEWGAEDGPRMV